MNEAYIYLTPNRPSLDVSGKKFAYLTVVGQPEKTKSGVRWLCECICGKRKMVYTHNLTSGATKHCGCKRGEDHLKHGHAAAETKEYGAWRNIHKRCYNRKGDKYEHYGGRGISVCERWSGKNGSTNFIKDMGLAPSHLHSLDRIDPNGNYEPTNCKWATAREQASNRRNTVYLEYGGEKKCLSEWASIIGIGPSTLAGHVKKGRSMEDVLKMKGIVRSKKEVHVIKHAFGFIS